MLFVLGDVMAKSTYANAVDTIQRILRPFFKESGFRMRGRTLNRTTEDGLTQVVNFQMGPLDPPATTYIPGLRENMYGLFTINLGVYVPEVARYHAGREAKSWVQEYHCCIRARLGETMGAGDDLWWHARMDDAIITDIDQCLRVGGLPFLDRFATRDRILSEWSGRAENMGVSCPPRIVMAIILVGRGQREQARHLLAQQALETRNPGHPAYVRKLAEALGLGRFNE